jgi:hypothetical protein
MMKFTAFTFLSMNPTEDNYSSEGGTLKPKPMTERQRKDARNAHERERRAARKHKAETEKRTEFTAESLAGEDADEPVKKKMKGQKKAAKRLTDVFEVSDEDDEPPKRFMVYFNIEGPKSGSITTGHLKAAPPPLVIKKGPFFHHTNDSFSTFKETIAALTPCNPDLLVLASLTWKFDTLANGVCHLMLNKVGYEAMLTAVRAKRGECVIFVYMPPQKKDMV